MRVGSAKPGQIFCSSHSARPKATCGLLITSKVWVYPSVCRLVRPSISQLDAFGVTTMGAEDSHGNPIPHPSEPRRLAPRYIRNAFFLTRMVVSDLQNCLGGHGTRS